MTLKYSETNESRRHAVDMHAFSHGLVMTLSHWPLKRSSNARSRDEYLCHVSLKSFHEEKRSRVTRNISYMDGRPARQKIWKRIVSAVDSSLLHDLLSCSYLQHCVWSVITGRNSLQTVCLQWDTHQCTACDKSKPSRRCNRHGWARTDDGPTIASREMRHKHAVDLTWPACRWTCATVFATKMR